MAVYAIGDLQGCFEELQRLLDRLHFDPAADRLWFAGDLVNRGPDSLATLRFVHSLGERAAVVLGNHDLHLLTLYAQGRGAEANATLRPIFAAEDVTVLLEWLRHQPLLHHDARLGFTMTHAGLPPAWDLAQAQACAREVEQALQGEGFAALSRRLYGNEPDRWRPDLTGLARLRYTVNALTRMRFCTADGRLDFTAKGAPGSQPPGLLPWFEVPARTPTGRLLFGHWSALGPVAAPGIYPLDTGCLWGGALSALRLDPAAGEPYYTRLPCEGYA
ncbi:MAG TPA: symmetrical bis(5'-nucleosyl)-tetraphosphatase [Gammaproteobacteria bacterium]|nr:symmetrical bis(5'-nucleosyl)-tetraphosphatase [Gammaproteobacteria bacterium]